MIRSILILSTIITLFACKSITVFVPKAEQLATEKKQTQRAAAIERYQDSWGNYVPDTAQLSQLPMRQIRVNFHIMNPENDSLAAIPEELGRESVQILLDAANSDLDTNINNWQSPKGTATLPRRYRYKLWPQTNDDGIYFHKDDELYYYVVSGANQNNYDRTVIDKYAIGRDTIVNVFITPHHPDSLKSKWYKASGQAIALGTDTKLSGIFELGRPPNEFRGMFNHEVGHILGLGHAWSNDGCDDTSDHPNQCYHWVPDKNCSNNMMDYNAYEIAVTPCQIGRMHQQMSTEGAHARALLVKDYCKLALPDLVITDTVSWTGHRDLVSNIIIENGAQLTLSARLSMPENAQILVKKGGTLILDGCKLHNACGLTWRGIITKKGAKVLIISPIALENQSKS
jgi:hypothetical protein